MVTYHTSECATTRRHRPTDCNVRLRFTLIELLVVVSIIALLAALLLPALGKARERAVLTQCMNNKKQIGMTLQLYGDDFQDVIPTSGNPKYNGSATFYYWRWFVHNGGYLTELEYTICPKYEYRKPDVAEVNAQKGYDGIYVPNTQSISVENDAAVKTFWGDATAGANFFKGIDMKRLEAHDEFMMVACQTSATDQYYGCGGKNFSHKNLSQYGGGQPTSLWLAHDQKTAASFADGHAEAANLERVTNGVSNGLRKDGTSTGIQYVLSESEILIFQP